jgi:hypothetical protein
MFTGASWQHPEGSDSNIFEPLRVSPSLPVNLSSLTIHVEPGVAIHRAPPTTPSSSSSHSHRLDEPVVISHAHVFTYIYIKKVHVDWMDATAFCAWRGMRLPTEIVICTSFCGQYIIFVMIFCVITIMVW